MTKYLLEIRSRVILLCLTWFSTVSICYFYKETLLFIIIQPCAFILLKEPTYPLYFIFTDVTEILSVYLKLIIFLSLQIFCIYMSYHFFLFVSPACFYIEYLLCAFAIKTIVIVWLISATVSTYLFIPFTWHFFLSFQELILAHSFSLYFETKLKEYLYFYISSYLLYLFYFQFLTLTLLLLNYKKLTIKKIKKFRKFNYYCFIILSTVISPPEILNQLCIGFTIIFLYELSLFLFLLRNQF